MKILTTIFCFVVFIANGQNEAIRSASFNLNEVALLNIEPFNSTVVLNLESPSSPGKKVKITTVNNVKWINFSSSISNRSSLRNISVKIEDGEVPPGMHLKLKTARYQGSGKGVLGNNNRLITLNNKSQIIISGIGGAYTGHGMYNGYKLTYSLDIYDYELLNIENSTTLTVSLTLTDF